MYTKVLLVTALIAACSVCAALAKTKNPFKNAFKSAAMGFMALLCVNVTAKATGCYIAVNWLTAFVASFLSLPGVVGMVILNLIFI